MRKEDILAKKNLVNVKKKIFVAKNNSNYIVVLPIVCRISKGQGWLEETSRILLTPSSPREAMGNNTYGLCCQPNNGLEFYNSA